MPTDKKQEYYEEMCLVWRRSTSPVSTYLHDDRGVEVLETCLGPNTMGNVEREGKNQADRQRNRHHVVYTLRPEHLWPESTPGNRVGCRLRERFATCARELALTVVTLRILAGPETSSRDRQES